MVNIAVLVSGGGTNLQALIDAEKAQNLGAGRLALCVSSNPNAYALTRAREHGMKTAVLSSREFPSQEMYADGLLEALDHEKVDLVVLAGFLAIVPNRVLERYRGRILNVHPSLIPSFCGKGFYGLRVHQAALAAGVKVTGATVHLVSEVIDGGTILLQKAVEVREDDTPESLQRRVMQEAEWILLPKATAQLCDEIAREKERER